MLISTGNKNGFEANKGDKLTLEAINTKNQIQIKCQVVWTKQYGNSFSLGVKFVEGNSTNSESFIKDIVNRQQYDQFFGKKESILI